MMIRKTNGYSLLLILWIVLVACQTNRPITPESSPIVKTTLSIESTTISTAETDLGTSTPEPTETPILPPTATPSYRDTTLSADARAAALVAQMTLQEKVGQMTLIEEGALQSSRIVTDYYLGGVLSGGGGHPEVNTAENWLNMIGRFQKQALDTRLAIPLFYGIDAVHGNAKVEDWTIFPHNIGLGATHDEALVEKIGRITAIEMRAIGANWNYDPVLAVPQDIRWGRTYEGFSEDPALVTLLGTAKLRGLQGSSLTQPDSVLGTPKHFVADGGAIWGSSDWIDGEGGRAWIDRGDAQIDEEFLRNVHLLPYLSAIKQGARSIMVSFSSWNGVKMHGNPKLLTDLLKKELGFTGFLVSDWGGVDAVAENYNDAVIQSINAGIDMVMVPSNYREFTKALTAAVENGDIPQERIDDAVIRILRVKFEAGLFDQATQDSALLEKIGSAEHRAIAREAVQKSIVLLKNEEGLIPLDKKAPVIFVAGEKADNIGTQSGGWTLEWQGVSGNFFGGTSILDGIKKTVSAETKLVYNRYGNFNKVAEKPDFCIAVVGEEPYSEWKGDSAEPQLGQPDLNVLKNSDWYCEKLVAVIISGRPIIITDQLPTINALLAAWLPGTEGGGVADILFGDAPLQGRLPYSWPASAEQLPFDFVEIAKKGCSPALFPIGYGLGVKEAKPLPICATQ